nr:TII-kininogen=plasma T-kinin precursor isoform II {N-terminal} [rats, Sprague-Dawley, Peptide Partial, 15 aa] [Rattus sp.]
EEGAQEMDCNDETVF